MVQKQDSDFEKFAALIVGEIRESEERMLGEIHAVEGRMTARMDTMQIDIAEIKDNIQNIWNEVRSIHKRLDELEERIG